MAETIIATILSTIAAAVIIELIFHGIKRESPLSHVLNHLRHILSSPKKSLINIKEKNIRDNEEVVRELFSFIKKDQDLYGPFLGQFGRGTIREEAKRYLTGPEKLNTKPRLYLTGWPIFVLTKYEDQLSARKVSVQLVGSLPHFSIRILAEHIKKINFGFKYS